MTIEPKTRVDTPMKGEFKFVQVDVDGEPYLFGRNMDGYHSDVLDSFLVERGVRFRTMESVHGDMPEERGERYHVRGMGYGRRDENGIVLRESSFGYKIRANEEHAEKLSKLTGISIRVEN
ncbi:hypothetical protein KAR91_88080 [Candidatus Pacearchaeota archaeon]|nr:hypothetical protein [Candidatus Pacearchaeota archaeon]